MESEYMEVNMALRVASILISVRKGEIKRADGWNGKWVEYHSLEREPSSESGECPRTPTCRDCDLDYVRSLTDQVPDFDGFPGHDIRVPSAEEVQYFKDRDDCFWNGGVSPVRPSSLDN